MLETGPGIDNLQEVKRRAAQIRAGQFELLDQRERAAFRQAHTTRWVLGICLALDGLLLAAVAWLVRDDIATRRKLAETLQEANAVLERKVAERTRELTEANARLTAENLERKWSAQAVEHQLRYNQVIVGATSDLVFVITKTLTITRVNPAVPERTGWPEEEILGKALGEQLQGIEAIGPALRGGRELPAQPTKLLARSGALLEGTFTLLPIRDNDKVVGGVVLVRLASTA
jgi:PAS domain-containing protein